MIFHQTTQLFDFQVNGFAGVDFQSDSLTQGEMHRAAAALKRHHMSAIFFTLITDDVDSLCRKFENIESICARDKDVRVIDSRIPFRRTLDIERGRLSRSSSIEFRS